MLHELSRPLSSARKSIQRGRWNGSGRGNYSTKWLKGQRARTGFTQQPWFEGGQTPLHMRLPKSRGFKKFFKLINYTVAINVGILNSDTRITSGSVITSDSLKELGYAKSGYGFKILGQWELTKSLTIQGISISASAKEIIEKLWWSIVI